MNAMLTLPHPPSLNRYWRHNRGRTHLSAEGLLYRRLVATECGGVRLGQGRLRVSIDWHPPDKRRRDIDNILKSIFDALEHAGVYADDSQIDELTVARLETAPSGKVVIGLEVIK